MTTWRRALVALAVAAAVAATRSAAADEAIARSGSSLKGQFLVATERMGDPRFARSVILMVDHDARGAMGLIVNRVLGQGPLDNLLKELGVDAKATGRDIRMYYGGPVEPSRGFILHTSDYQGPGTMAVADGIALTVAADVLKALAEGRGPKRSLVILGYAGWAPRQLEGEIDRGDWVTGPLDAEVVFDDDVETKWRRATAHAGIEL